MDIKPVEWKRVIAEDKFYIFGAGQIGSLTIRYLKRTYGLKPTAFLVSDLTNQPKEISGIPVRRIDELKDKDALILIATLFISRAEIATLLKELGFCRVYEINEQIFWEMRRSIVSRKDELASQKIRISELMREIPDFDKDTVIVSDHLLSEVVKWRKVSVISTKEFLDGESSYENLVLLLVDWEYGIETILAKAYQVGGRIFLSICSRYLETKQFHLINDAKRRGFQIFAYRSFLRPVWEFEREDALIFLERRSVSALERDQLCVGCGKCVEVCPHQALSLQPDANGNYKPFLDKRECVDCGSCLEACPVYHVGKSDTEKESPAECYAFLADDKIRERSSSGGAFSILAETLLADGVSVCGAVWKEDFSVEHRFIDERNQLDSLRRSKYVRSNIQSIYSELYQRSLSGQRSAFFGCPCQVAALKEYLGELSKKVLFVDLLCTQAPSDQIFQKYLKENFELDQLKQIGFREKSEGWRADSFYTISKDGECVIRRWEDSYQRAYHMKLMMPIHCEHCAFSDFPRVGDLTIGDFWGIGEHDASMDDQKGTSVVFVNSDKGRRYQTVLSDAAKCMKKEPVEWVVQHNRIGNNIKPHRGRDRFYDELASGKRFNQSVDNILEGKFDIGLVGNWSYPNYGTELSYYSLFYTLRNAGYSITLIEWAEDSPWAPYGCTQLFETEPYRSYEIAEKASHLCDMRKYNLLSERFVHGSDQLLSPLHYFALQQSVTMPWTTLIKKKIAYAYSFGKERVDYAPQDQDVIGAYLRQFDAVSARERSAVRNMKEMFHTEAELVLEPVFLSEREVYDRLIPKKRSESGEFVFAYLLDISWEKFCQVKRIANELGTALIIVSDASIEDNISGFSDCQIYTEVSLNEWLGFVNDCTYMITDSFHGTCMAIIYRKQFLSVVNQRRGATRFDSLTEMLGIGERMVASFEELRADRLTEGFDYRETEKQLEERRKKSIEWLISSLEAEKNRHFTDLEMILAEKCYQLEMQLMKIRQEEE